MKIFERSAKKANKKANRSSKPRRHGTLSRHECNQIASRRRPMDNEVMMAHFKAMFQSAIRREQEHIRLGSRRLEPESPLPSPVPDLEQ